MSNEILATYANYALWSAILVITMAMIGHALYLAWTVPEREAADEAVPQEATAPEREVVAAGAGSKGASAGSAGDAVDLDDGASASVEDDGSVPVRARKAAGIASTLGWLGTMLLLTSMVLRGVAVSRPPLGNLFEFSVSGTFFAMAAYSIWSLRRDLRWLGVFVTVPVVLILGVASTVWYQPADELVPSLKSYWLPIHVTVATLSVGIFIVGAAIVALYLASDRQIGGERFWRKLPPAASLEKLAYSLHIVAFPLWTFTLIAGAIWAREAWGAYWTWDPKEVWTFVIWTVYAAYLHARATKNTPRRTANWIALAGFACIIINYTVVNFYFIGMHSYAQ